MALARWFEQGEGIEPQTRMAPTMLHVGAIRDHKAGYLRPTFRSLMLPVKPLGR